MRRMLVALALFGAAWAGVARAAGPAEEARRLYEAFAAAQNAHDFAAVRATLLESPRFL
jgi:hypothetical protein